MKNPNLISLFWALAWFVVFALAIIGIFWTPAIYAVGTFSATMCGMFIYDYIHVKRIK